MVEPPPVSVGSDRPALTPVARPARHGRRSRIDGPGGTVCRAQIGPEIHDWSCRPRPAPCAAPHLTIRRPCPTFDTAPHSRMTSYVGVSPAHRSAPKATSSIVVPGRASSDRERSRPAGTRTTPFAQKEASWVALAGRSHRTRSRSDVTAPRGRSLPARSRMDAHDGRDWGKDSLARQRHGPRAALERPRPLLAERARSGAQ